MKIGNPTDFWGGTMFAVVGALFAIGAYGLKLPASRNACSCAVVVRLSTALR